ncbi:MAG: RdgB/HAM1 family non-canonical purine NTP pyrophosphatase [Verrucomicrobia bacterium]|nr:MAG: RdgB/HAM1 family non-canonical purine NTP pyrophosphatase [Verrucomicrobiota bacterium]
MSDIVQTAPRPKIIIATRNFHKTAEIRAMIGAAADVFDVLAFPELPEIEETGRTFLENARLKAIGISREIDGWVLADDSGLEVDVLDGAPGVISSSYGGIEGDHARNCFYLIEKMQGHSQRSARFCCTMVLAKNGEEVAHFFGTVEGHLLDHMSGQGGFGYDPLFVPEGYSESFAELGDEVKNQLSHRARALAQVVIYLRSIGLLK